MATTIARASARPAATVPRGRITGRSSTGRASAGRADGRRDAGLGRHATAPVELRHTAASPAIASGADVEVLPLLLGHSAATPTLDLYGHLFPDRLDELADRFDRAVCAPDVPQDPSEDDDEDDQ
ncbi:hypothetical protein GCM10023200_05280 [Actinomycetospora chlora]|uniref:Tyr recombinase domain-containing protein n=1 Tax=Actinomycetospora chlora TaxID=663608 RepID=A0ABP9A7Z5_9PSEU